MKLPNGMIVLPRIHSTYADGEFMGVVGRNTLQPDHDYLLIDLGYAPRCMHHADVLSWARSIGGDLPDRREGRLLWANRRDGQFADGAHWLSEQYAGDGDYAWCQYFDTGNQNINRKYDALLALAVRRVPLGGPT